MKKFILTLQILFFALLFGFLFESLMTIFWHYDMLNYFLGVPYVIVLAWGIFLTLGYFVFNKLNKFKFFKKLPDFLDVLILYVPSIILIEFIGRPLIGIKINETFTCLIGNFMCAPLIYYIALYFVCLTFWYSFRNY